MLQSTRDSSFTLTELLTIVSRATEQASEKTDQDVQQEIQSIFRQITASITFLPMLDGNCTFNVLVYADQDSEVPLEWGDSDAKDIQDAEKVQLRSFSTNNHKVDTLVSYRYVAANIVTCLACRIYIWHVSNRLAEWALRRGDLWQAETKVRAATSVEHLEITKMPKSSLSKTQPDGWVLWDSPKATSVNTRV
jgi:hypothetical protein